jgi:hypothetical protein
MIEYLAPGFIYSVIKDGWAAWGRRKLSPSQVLALRQKWKPLFEEDIWKNHSEKLRDDVIVRDVKRMDSYPEIDPEAKGISPWFRVGLIGTYYKGILIGIRWGELKKTGENGTWRYIDYRNETGDVKAVLAGKVPFENIEAVDWHGDEYYPYPHIYCHFIAKRKQPYEKVSYYRAVSDSLGRPHYTEIATPEDVREVSKNFALDLSF